MYGRRVYLALALFAVPVIGMAVYVAIKGPMQPWSDWRKNLRTAVDEGNRSEAAVLLLAPVIAVGWPAFYISLGIALVVVFVDWVVGL